MRPASEPRFDLGCFVDCVVIHDDMDIEPFRGLGIDLFEELQEFDRPVTLVAFADDKPRGDIECGKQCGSTMPHIAVRATSGTPGIIGRRLLAIKCLDLAFLIDAEDKGSVRRGQVKPDDIACTLSTNSGSLDNLNVWLRCGCKLESGAACQSRRVGVGTCAM